MILGSSTLQNEFYCFAQSILIHIEKKPERGIEIKNKCKIRELSNIPLVIFISQTTFQKIVFYNMFIICLPSPECTLQESKDCFDPCCIFGVWSRALNGVDSQKFNE